MRILIADDSRDIADVVEGKEAKRCFMGHALMGNRHGLLVDFQMTGATGTAE